MTALHYYPWKAFFGMLSIAAIWLATACGLVSKYADGQHRVYAEMLTAKEKEQISRTGEITKDIEFNNPTSNTILKGTLRVIRTDDPDIFNFVEIGQWINHSRISSSGKYHNREFRDTIVSDNLGNILSRAIYYNDRDDRYVLGERWTSKKGNNSFIRHVKIFNNNVLISEFDMKIIDFNAPKSGLQKQGVIIGIRKDYSASGQLVSTKTFDENGKLIREERQVR